MKKILITALLCCCAAPASAGSAGAEPFNFLLLDAGARGVGLGGAYTALASDAWALHYNPGGLGRVGRAQAAFMHNRYFQDITQQYLGWASPSGFGAAVNYLDFGGATETTISNPSGADRLGEVNMTGLAAAAGYGRYLGAGISAGAGLKFVKETVAGASGRGFAADIGLLYTPGSLKGLSLGAALQNLGASVRFQEDREDLPLTLRAGAAYAGAVKGVPCLIAFDAVKERSGDVYAAAGAEAVIAGSFPVRLGYSGRGDDGSGITAGLGYALNSLNFDYGFAPFKELGAAHRFSVTYMWGKAR